MSLDREHDTEGKTKDAIYAKGGGKINEKKALLFGGEKILVRSVSIGRTEDVMGKRQESKCRRSVVSITRAGTAS